MNDLGFEPLADVLARLVEKLARPDATPAMAAYSPHDAAAARTQAFSATDPPAHHALSGIRPQPGQHGGSMRVVRLVFPSGHYIAAAFHDARHIRRGGTEYVAGRPETGRRPASAGACTADVKVAVFGEFKKAGAFALRSLEGIADSPAAYVRGGLDSRTPAGEGPAPPASVAPLEAMP